MLIILYMNQIISLITFALMTVTAIFVITDFEIDVVMGQSNEELSNATVTGGKSGNITTTDEEISVATPYDNSQENRTFYDPQECDHPSNCNHGHLP